MFTVLSLSVVVDATAWASLLKPSICPSRLFFSSSSFPPLLLLLPTYLYCFVFSVLSLFSVNVLFLSKAFCCLRINCLFLLFSACLGCISSFADFCLRPRSLNIALSSLFFLLLPCLSCLTCVFSKTASYLSISGISFSGFWSNGTVADGTLQGTITAKKDSEILSLLSSRIIS